MDIAQAFAHKNIFISGATGFLAKLFLEKILRIQPLVKKVFLLIRETPDQSVEQRLQKKVYESELFGVLKEKYGANLNYVQKDKIIPISGDVSLENLGIIDPMLREKLQNEVDIIVNSAATTRFDERYDIALGINTLGAMNVINFAKTCLNLEMILHVSTAYVHSAMVGLLSEKPFNMEETLVGAKISHVDIDRETKVVKTKLEELRAQNKTEREITLAMKDLGIERARLHGWPNTYVFTKAMGEMLLGTFKGKPTIIVLRPTIITSTYKDPFPGWIEGLRTLDSVFVAYGKGKTKVFVGDPHSTMDLIPGDLVVNVMLAALAAHLTILPSDKKLIIYQICSSPRNPIKNKDVADLMYRFLKKNPLVDGGKLVMVRELKLLNSLAKFQEYNRIRYLPFFMLLMLLNKIACNCYRDSYAKAMRSFRSIIQLADYYKPYMFLTGLFDDFNAENLRRLMRGNNTNLDMFGFDPLCIQWEEYLVHIHFAGIVKYVLK